MSQPSRPPSAQPSDPPAADDQREPEDSPQRRLVETVQAFEVDPPAPARAQDDAEHGPGA